MALNITKCAIPGVLIIEPQVFEDQRGFFVEAFNRGLYRQQVSPDYEFVQDNHSQSKQWVIRGLHYQTDRIQDKLVRVVHGQVFDVAVDLRKNSPTYGQWHGQILSAENKLQLWIPRGMAHGFLTLSDSADLLYKTTDYYAPGYEASIAWNDPTLNINWPIPKGIEPILSSKDATAPFFHR